MCKVIKFLFFLIVLGVLLTISCKKEELEAYDPDFIGEWHSDTMIITSTGEKTENYLKVSSSNCEYGFMCQINCAPCACQDLFSGNATINRKHKRIYIGKGRKAFLKIEEFPSQVNGRWKCVIQGVAMYRN